MKSKNNPYNPPAIWFEYWVAVDIARTEPQKAMAYYGQSHLRRMVEKHTLGAVKIDFTQGGTKEWPGCIAVGSNTIPWNEFFRLCYIGCPAPARGELNPALGPTAIHWKFDHRDD